MATQVGFDSALTQIETQIGNAENRASDAVSNAFNAINNMAAAAQTVPPFLTFNAPNISLATPSVSTVAPTKPDSEIAAIKAALGSAPSDFTASVDDRITQDAPQETFTTPNIVFPTDPTFNPLVKPSPQTVTLPDDIPDVPSLTIPTTLVVGGITIPAVPSISNPSWDITIPSIDIDLPETTLAYVEPVYTSALKTAITTSLLSGVENGGTGLGATIETNLWNRDIERLSQQRDDDLEEAINFWGARGFTLPHGMVQKAIEVVQDKFTQNRAESSRNISNEQAKIAKEMTQFFLSTGLNLEQIELNHANNVANRALEAEKAVVQFSIDLFNSKASKFNLELSRYQAQSAEIEARLKIQALILDQYRAELASVEIQDKIDRTAIDNYRAILSSHDASIKLYEAEVGAKIAEMNIEAKKIDIFRSEIDAYVAQISAQKSEYDLYLAKIEGQTAKVQLHKTEVEAYATRVDAVKTSNDTIIEKIKSDIAIEDMNLRAHLANVDIYKTKSDLAIREMSTEADLYRTDGSIYATDLDLITKFSELQVQTQIRAAALDQQNANMSLQASIANLTAITEANKIRLSASSAQAQASSALAGMTAGAIQGMLQLGGQGTALETTDVSS
jgi:hypothetical protein